MPFIIYIEKRKAIATLFWNIHLGTKGKEDEEQEEKKTTQT